MYIGFSIDRKELLIEEQSVCCKKPTGRKRKIWVGIILIARLFFDPLPNKDTTSVQPDKGQVECVVQTKVFYHPYLRLEGVEGPPYLASSQCDKPLLMLYNPLLFNYDNSVVNNLRGGDWTWTEYTWFFITLWWLHYQSSDAFQPIAAQHQYPPARNLLPGLGKKPTEQSSTLRMSNIPGNLAPTQTQVMEKFVDSNGKVDLNLAYQEVERRAQAIGNPDFSCSFDRFKELAIEGGQITPLITRAAISGLQFEAQGLVINLRRSAVQDPNNLGLDFEIDGPPPYTHFEQKGPVGSAIRKAAHLPPSITKQGKKIGQKALHQKKVWSGDGEGKALTSGNILIGVDCFDVPVFEKAAMEAAVLKGAKNNPDIVFINNVTNK